MQSFSQNASECRQNMDIRCFLTCSLRAREPWGWVADGGNRSFKMREFNCVNLELSFCFILLPILPSSAVSALQGDWAESYAALGTNSSTSSRGFRVQVEKAKLEEVSSENLRSFERSPVASRDPQGSASRSFSTESPQGSQGFQHDGSELVRWKSFCDLKRVW